MAITIKQDGDGDQVVATATDMRVTTDYIDVMNAGLQYAQGVTSFVVDAYYRIRQNNSNYHVKYYGSAGLGSAAQRFSRK